MTESYPFTCRKLRESKKFWPTSACADSAGWCGSILFANVVSHLLTEHWSNIFTHDLFQAALRKILALCPNTDMTAVDYHQLIKPKLMDSFLMCSNSDENFVWCFCDDCDVINWLLAEIVICWWLLLSDRIYCLLTPYHTVQTFNNLKE